MRFGQQRKLNRLTIGDADRDLRPEDFRPLVDRLNALIDSHNHLVDVQRTHGNIQAGEGIRVEEAANGLIIGLADGGIDGTPRQDNEPDGDDGGGIDFGNCDNPIDLVIDTVTELTDPNVWERETSGIQNRGATIRIVTRVVYLPNSDQVLYAFTRDLNFDSNGMLCSVSGETRRTVDTPEEC